MSSDLLSYETDEVLKFEKHSKYRKTAEVTQAKQTKVSQLQPFLRLVL